MLDRLVRDTPARAWVLQTLAAASAEPHRATSALRQASREARKLRSRERRALWDVAYTLIRWECLGPTWEGRLDAWLRGALPSGSFSTRAGLPEPLGRLLAASWDDPEAWLEASNQRAPTDLRVTTRRTSRASLAAALKRDDIHTRPIGRQGLELEGRANLIGHPSFRKGHFEIQDRASQRVSDFVDASGQTVLDLCAGAGGKSLAMADVGAKVTATDTRTRALDELAHRAERAHVRIQRIPLPHDGDLSALGTRTFERVLVDAPCSGSGVWRRHPEYRWRLQSLDALAAFTTLQGELLERAHPKVAEGGVLIYATCSALDAENRVVVSSFLERHPTWELAREMQTAPHLHNSDGLYAAALVRS